MKKKQLNNIEKTIKKIESELQENIEINSSSN